MGAWGLGIFSNDIALDVRSDYQTLLAFGTPEDEAYNLVRYADRNGKISTPEEKEERQKRSLLGCLNIGKLTQEEYDQQYAEQFGPDRAYYHEMLREEENREEAFRLTSISHGIPVDVLKDMLYNSNFDDSPEFWFAMAALQHKYGILMDEVRDNAIMHMRDGVDELCDDLPPRDKKARAKILADLKAKLLGPQPPKRKVPKPRYYSKPRWEVGDIILSKILFSTFAGEWFYEKYVLYRVLFVSRYDFCRLKPGLALSEHAYGIMYDWIGDEVPDQSILDTIGYYKDPNLDNKLYIYGLNWIPKNEKYTLFKRGNSTPMPAKEELRWYSPSGGGDTIYNTFRSPFYNAYFKEVYEKYKGSSIK